MPDIVTCPNCEKKLKIPEALQGQSVKCPGCAEIFFPGGGPAPAPPPDRRSDRVTKRSSSRALAPISKRGHDDNFDDEDDDDDDDFDDRPRRRKKRRRRRGDYAPHRGQTILVLGILSLFIAGFVLGPIAWIMGNKDLKEIQEGRMDPEGESSTSTGRICGMIGTIINIVGLSIGLIIALIYVLFIALYFGACCCLFIFAGAAAPPPPGPDGF